MKKKDIIRKSSLFVRKSLEHAEAGHDWLHVERVMENARRILKKEKADKQVVLLGILFHDLADPKFHDDDEKKGPGITAAFLREMGVPSGTVSQVLDIVQNISYKGGHQVNTGLTPELKIARDADRLDAIGAIGIARAFHYGGFKNRKLYEPGVKPVKYKSADDYRNSEAPTLNHFYEKLLLLKDGMYTKTARKIAIKRHKFMVRFLKELKKEIKGKN